MRLSFTRLTLNKGFVLKSKQVPALKSTSVLVVTCRNGTVTESFHQETALNFSAWLECAFYQPDLMGQAAYP